MRPIDDESLISPLPSPKTSILASYYRMPGPARCGKMETMGRQSANVLYVLAMVAVIVGVDILFFRGHLWERLLVNIGIVMVFVAFFLRFLKPS